MFTEVEEYQEKLHRTEGQIELGSGPERCATKARPKIMDNDSSHQSLV
jgi:hypothetical protein